jgi:hypothetical protein
MTRPVGTNRAGLKIGASVGEKRADGDLNFAAADWSLSPLQRFKAIAGAFRSPVAVIKYH